MSNTQPTLMHTVSGMGIVLNDVAHTSIDLEDIGIALSNICRFGGHVDRFYSVLSHCLTAYDMAPPEHKAEALLHDAAEAYIGDIIVPVKELFPYIGEYEHRLAGKIFEKFTPNSPCLQNGVYVKSDYMKALDAKLASGESFELQGHNAWHVHDSEVYRAMVRRWHATPEDYFEAYDTIRGAVQQ